jgi:Protein of unknown function (DUF3105)
VASRKEEKEQRRAERLAREQKESEDARRRRRYSMVVGGILAVAAIAAVVVALVAGGGNKVASAGGLAAPSENYKGAADPPAQAVTDLPQAAKAAGCVLKNPVIEGRTHIPPDQKVTYKTNPPTSGNHDPVPADDGVYSTAPNSKTIRHFVHTLEHGRVELQYDPSLPKQRINQLGGLFNEDPYHMLLFPNTRMPYKVAATAWGHLIGCEKVTDKTFDALRAFRDRYRDQGPETVA